MKLIFYILSFIPISHVRVVITLLAKAGFYKIFNAYKVTHRNLEMSYRDLSKIEIKKLAIESIIESFISVFETIQSWGRPIHISGKKIFRVENNFLLNKYIEDGDGVAVIAIHNRSVDMLLKWINTKCETTTLYKQVKIKALDKFVKKQREGKSNKVYETNMNGVRKIYQAFKANKTICIAADQVPQRGMGEYIKLFNNDAYTTTLASSLMYKTSKPGVFACLNSFGNNNLGVTIRPCKNNIYIESEYKLSLNQSIEELININPKDYSWEYKRYRRPPSGQDPYLNL